MKLVPSSTHSQWPKSQPVNFGLFPKVAGRRGLLAFLTQSGPGLGHGRMGDVCDAPVPSSSSPLPCLWVVPSSGTVSNTFLCLKNSHEMTFPGLYMSSFLGYVS